MGKEMMIRRQEKVIAALLSTNTREEAAKGIISNSTEQIQKSLSPAITTLKAIVEDDSANIHARVSAARSLLEYGIRLTEINDIGARLDKLEEAISEE